MGKKRLVLIVYLISILFFIVSFFIDKKVSYYTAFIRNSVLDYSLSSITQFGSVFIILVFMTTLFLWKERKREWIPVLWTSLFVSTMTCIILKSIIARPRPLDIFAVSSLILYSFPSLHATAAFTVIPVLDKEFPKFKWFWVIFALLVAFSRIYFQYHYLSDVIGGALIGYSFGWLFVHLEERDKIFKKWKIGLS
ncbi:phosphatase PAP2 family protein [Candidatus Woesearchaeota archaeon]|nr:phosphatase PAP2 family protein [Candidatus Woesearchaeota archaeon]